MKYLGLDLGTKTLGLSISDKDGKLSLPFKTLYYSNTDDLIDELVNIISENRIDELVIGLPKNMNNTLGNAVDRVNLFCDLLKVKTDIKINYQDERLSSVSVNRFLIDNNMRREKRKKVVDSLAAQIILQTFIDRRK